MSTWTNLLKNRIAQWTLIYAAVAYTVLHGIETMSGAFGWPAVVGSTMTLILAVGVPVIAVLAWRSNRSGARPKSIMELVALTLLVNTLLWSLARTSLVPMSDKSATRAGVAEIAVSPPAVPAPRSAVAVLPFTNLTGEAAKDYLGEGIAEELINSLSRVSGLTVPARSSSFAYKGRNVDARRIAQDLHVGTLLDGSVRSAGERIRVSVELIDAQTGAHLWSQSYDHEFTDIFKLEDEVTGAIVAALQVELVGDKPGMLTTAPPTRDAEAYNDYLQGQSLVGRVSEENAARAIAYFEQAIARDPNFARAYAGIADAHLPLAGTLGLHPFEHLAAGEKAALRALQLDSHLARAHNALAGISGLRGDYLSQEQHDRAAMALDGRDGFVYMVRGSHLGSAGHLQEMLKMAEQAYALAPAHPQVVAFLANAYSIVGQDGEAAKYVAIATDLGYPVHSDPLAVVQARAARRVRDFAAAAAAVAMTFDLADEEQHRTAEITQLTYAALADPATRPAALAARVRLYPLAGAMRARAGRATNALPCLRSSLALALLGDNDAAYSLGNQCLDRLAPQAVRNIGTSTDLWTPELRPFRADPRFHNFANRLGLLAYYREFGAPDDCEIRDSHLICH